jgi:hypothetical protein
MQHIKPPDPLNVDRTRPSVFLAGSIEQGTTDDWQAVFTQGLQDLDITVLNPRRNAWDASWPQSMEFAPFREQVEWELEAQEQVDLIAFYFVPATRSPITLLELGLAAGRRRAIVCCPDGFWRKGNVDVVCSRYRIPQVATLDELLLRVRSEAQRNQSSL